MSIIKVIEAPPPVENFIISQRRRKQRAANRPKPPTLILDFVNGKYQIES